VPKPIFKAKAKEKYHGVGRHQVTPTKNLPFPFFISDSSQSNSWFNIGARPPESFSAASGASRIPCKIASERFRNAPWLSRRDIQGQTLDREAIPILRNFFVGLTEIWSGYQLSFQLTQYGIEMLHHLPGDRRALDPGANKRPPSLTAVKILNALVPRNLSDNSPVASPSKYSTL
jgi:hypothetical protein